MTERPRYYAYEIGERSNMTYDPHKMRIHDMRPISSDVSLDTQGFAFVEQRSAVQDFWDDDEVRRVYYPEAEQIIKQVTGASRVFIFDHLQRRRVAGLQDRTTGGPRPAGDARACRSYRELRPATGSRSLARRGGGIVEGARPGYQSIAP